MFSTTMHTDPNGRSTANPATLVNNFIKTQTGKQPPAIKSIADKKVAGRSERDREIAHLLSLKLNPVVTTGGASNIPVLKVRSPQPMSAEQATAAGFRLVNQGVPEHGVILHYGQLHHVEIPGLVASENAPCKTGPLLKAKIIQCQRKIFDELLNRGIRHVFSEGLQETLVPDEFVSGSQNAAVRDKIRAGFKGYRPGDILSPELENLLYAGGCLIYGHLATGVTLHPTMTASQAAKHDAYYNEEASRARFIANQFSVPLDDRHIFFEEVEQITMVEMRRVMQGNSLSVALVFGRAHLAEDFSKYCKDARFSPAFYFKDVTA